MQKLKLSFFYLWSSLLGTSFTWNGAGTDWGIMTNWTPSTGVPSAAGDAAVFQSGTVPNPPSLGGTNYQLSTLQFDSGASAITISGTGALQFIQSPLITVNSTGHLISANVTLNNSLSVTVGGSSSFTISGTISGANPLALSGAGTTILSGTNTYTGGTTVNTGILQISNSGSLGLSTSSLTLTSGTLQTTTNVTLPSTRNIQVSGTSIFQPTANTLTIDGVISGDSITKQGSNGTLVLSGDNTYTGDTTIKQGILQVSKNSSLGSPSSSLILENSATFQAGGIFSLETSGQSRSVSLTGSTTIDTGFSTLTIPGVISGTGSLTKQGAGELLLTGLNTYSGGTTVAQGELYGTTESLQGSIAISGGQILRFTQSFDGAFQGTLSLGGSLEVQGGGVITMNQNSPSFTGTTTITGAELVVNGSLSGSSVTIDSGGRLSGAGSVASVASIDSTGFISPGVSGIGTLNIGDTIDFSLGGTQEVQVNGMDAGKVLVTNAATLTNGKVLVIKPENAGFFGLSQTYTILEASSLVGAFAPATSLDPNFSLTGPVNVGNTVQLTVRTLAPFSDFPFENRNEESVGENLDALSLHGNLSSQMELFLNSLSGESDETVSEILNQMHPAALSATAELQTELASQALNLLHRRAPLPCFCSQKNRFWAVPFGNWLREKSQGMQVGFHATTGGLAFGYDREFFNSWTLGVAGIWNQSSVEWSLSQGKSSQAGFWGALYSDLYLDQWYLGGSFYAGKDFLDTTREIHFPISTLKAKSSYSALDIGGQLTTRYLFGSPLAFVYPYFTGSYLHFAQDSFSEKGAGSFNLDVDSYVSGTIRLETGAGFRVQDKSYRNRACVSPLFSMGYVYQKPISRDAFSSNFEGQNITFPTWGWDKTWHLLNVRFGLAISYKCYSLDSDYVADISPSGDRPFFNQRANFRFNYSF